MRDAGGARLCAPKRFLAPRQPQPFKVNLADQRDAPSPSQAGSAMPAGAILTKAGAILPQPDCNSRRGIAPDCTKLHQIAPNCTRLRSLRQKIKKEKTRPEELYSAPINGQPAAARLPPPPGFGGQVGGQVGEAGGQWKMVNYPPEPSSCQKPGCTLIKMNKHFRVSRRAYDRLAGWKRRHAYFTPLLKPTRRMTNTTVRSGQNSAWQSCSIWSNPNNPMNLSKDLREFVVLLKSRKIKYVLVGGHAVAYHGFPRFTGDVDFFIDTSLENAARVAAAAGDFGFANLGLAEADFRKPETVVRLGRVPHGIDILTSVTAVSFAAAWETRIETKLDGLPIWVVSKDLLVRNKLAAGRPARSGGRQKTGLVCHPLNACIRLSPAAPPSGSQSDLRRELLICNTETFGL